MNVMNADKFRAEMAAAFGVAERTLFGPSQGMFPTFYQRAAMIAALRHRKINGQPMSFPRIGTLVKRDHSSCVSAYERTRELMKDPTFVTMYEIADEVINGNKPPEGWQLDLLGGEPVRAEYTPPLLGASL